MKKGSQKSNEKWMRFLVCFWVLIRRAGGRGGGHGAYYLARILQNLEHAVLPCSWQGAADPKAYTSAAAPLSWGHLGAPLFDIVLFTDEPSCQCCDRKS